MGGKCDNKEGNFKGAHLFPRFLRYKSREGMTLQRFRVYLSWQEEFIALCTIECQSRLFNVNMMHVIYDMK
jgi:hypothetical protein